MIDVTSFWFYLSVHDINGLYRDIRDSDIDLIILEAGNTSRTEGVFPSLTGQELQALEQAGQTVIGYVNVALADFNRSFWQDDWVTPIADDPDDFDYGTINASAPDWLQNSFGVATGPEASGDGIFGYIVDYRDPDWQAIVIEQADALVEAGYAGVFLDDVGRYYDAAEQNSASAGGDPSPAEVEPFAQSMIDLVNAVSEAIRAVDPDAYIATNGGAYLKFDADAENGAYAGYTAFRDTLDGLLIENIYRTQPEAWTEAAEFFARPAPAQPVDFLAVEWADSLSAVQEQDFLNRFASENGVLPMLAATPEYDMPPPLSGAGVQMSISDGAVYRLYDAVFDRAPDPAGFQFWSRLLERNALDLFDMADQFILSPEFQQTFGPLQDAAFLTAIYQNVLDRTPDHDGYAFWLNALDAGVTRAELVVGFSESTEFRMTTEAELGTWFDIWG